MNFSFNKKASLQLSMILATLLYVTGVLIWQYKSDFYAEEIYPVKNVDKMTRKLSSKVRVGLHINKFPLFSFHKNRFIMDAFVWFKFNIGQESLNTISKFSFQNAILNNNELLYKSPPIIKKIKDDVVITYHVQLEFKANLDHTYFPIGDRRLNIVLENRFVTPNEITFKCDSKDFVLADNILVSTWAPKQTIVQTGYIVSNTSKGDKRMKIEYPCVVFTIDFENTSKRDLITLYFPMFVIFLIGLLSLSLGLKDGARLGLIAAALPILVLFRTAIDALSPNVGEATKVDYIYFVLVFLSLLILLFQAYLAIRIRMEEDKGKLPPKKRASLEKLNYIVFISILILLIIFVTYGSK